MNRCATCCHWTRIVNQERIAGMMRPKATRFGRCEKLARENMYSACPSDRIRYPAASRDAYDPAGLETGEEFGCIHHKPACR